MSTLLSLRACELMGLVVIKDENTNIAAIAVEQEFKDVFSNKLGELPGVASLQLKSDAISAVMANRRVFVSVRPQLKAELKRLTKMDFIDPVDKHTP